MKKSLLKNTLFALCVGGLSLFSFAQFSSARSTEEPTDTKWTGAAGDSKWETAGNWENGVLPSPSWLTMTEISTDGEVRISSQAEAGAMFLHKGSLICGKGFGLTVAVRLSIGKESRFSLNGGKLTLAQSGLLDIHNLDLTKRETMDLEGGTIEIATGTGTGTSTLWIGSALLGTQSKKVDGNIIPLERVTEYLMINGDQKNLEDYVATLKVHDFSLEDKTKLTQYKGDAPGDNLDKSQYYVFAEDGKLAINYWRQKENWIPGPSGDLVPEPSTASLSLLALSALLLRRRRG